MNMKKALAFMMTVMMVLCLLGCTASAEKARVMASFYPMSILAMTVSRTFSWIA